MERVAKNRKTTPSGDGRNGGNIVRTLKDKPPVPGQYFQEDSDEFLQFDDFPLAECTPPVTPRSDVTVATSAGGSSTPLPTPISTTTHMSEFPTTAADVGVNGAYVNLLGKGLLGLSQLVEAGVVNVANSVNVGDVAVEQPGYELLVRQMRVEEEELLNELVQVGFVFVLAYLSFCGGTGSCAGTSRKFPQHATPSDCTIMLHLTEIISFFPFSYILFIPYPHFLFALKSVFFSL